MEQEIVTEENTYSDFENVQTVSGSDSVVYYIPLTVSSGDSETIQPEENNLWTKPFEDYTVSEGLLFLIFCISLTALISGFFGGFKWRR